MIFEEVKWETHCTRNAIQCNDEIRFGNTELANSCCAHATFLLITTWVLKKRLCAERYARFILYKGGLINQRTTGVKKKLTLATILTGDEVWHHYCESAFPQRGWGFFITESFGMYLKKVPQKYA